MEGISVVGVVGGVRLVTPVCTMVAAAEETVGEIEIEEVITEGLTEELLLVRTVCVLW